MIRVLHVITDSNIGGAGHMLLALLDACDRSHFHLEVALPENSRLIPGLQARGVAYTEVPYIAERSFSWPAVRVLCGLIKARRPHIVHTHAALSARLAARLRGCRIVHTRHSVFTDARDDTQPARLMRSVSRQLGSVVNNSLSDAMIAVSPAAKDDLLRVGADERKITVIYNGVPPVRACSPAERAALRVKYGVPPDAFVVAQVARLTAVKGHDYTLEAFKALRGTKLLLLIAGDGPRQAHLARRLVEESIDNVRLLGFVTAVDELLHIMDIQVNASFGTEATSLALLQGMSLGVPAVASDYGGNPYVITHEDNGLLVPQKDARALAAAVRRLSEDDTLYRRLSEGALRQYAARFTAAEMAAKTEALYRRLVKDGCT